MKGRDGQYGVLDTNVSEAKERRRYARSSGLKVPLSEEQRGTRADTKVGGSVHSTERTLQPEQTFIDRFKSRRGKAI